MKGTGKRPQTASVANAYSPRIDDRPKDGSGTPKRRKQAQKRLFDSKGIVPSDLMSVEMAYWHIEDEYTAHDIRCGLHSGIPICCVAYFITQWQPSEKNKFGIHAASNRREQLDYPKVGYIPCEQCIRDKNFIPVVHECSCYPEKMDIRERPRR